MESERPRRLLSKVLIIVFFSLSIGSSAGAYYFYGKYEELKANPQKIAQDEISVLLEKVGQLIDLPSDETPTVATVSDPEKLKSQPFFAKAKQGDKVIIYTGAKKAILYDPTADKIIEVAPVNVGDSAKTDEDREEDTSAKKKSSAPSKESDDNE
jgi:hypothetical protein